MNRFDLPYVTLTAALGVALFCAGRWSAPTPHASVVYVPDAPLVQARQEPLIPPPPPAAEPVVTPVSAPSQVPSAVVPPPAVRYAPAPTVSANPSASVVKPPPPPPEVIVLEEIPDNPYRARK